MRQITKILILALLLPWMAEARSYSSGSRGYSSSRSYGGSSSRSYSSSKGGSFGGSSHSYSPSSSKSSESKSFSANSGKRYSSGGGSTESGDSGHSGEAIASSHNDAGASASKSGPGAFDTAAAQAKNRESSRRIFGEWKNTTTASPGGGGDYGRGSYTSSGEGGRSGRSYGTYTSFPGHVYYPTHDIIITRPARIRQYFSVYQSYPVVYYHDPFGSLFWWWLLDQSLDTRADWAYHHRYEMDQERYNRLMADEALAQRVKNLENQHVAVNPNYTPTGMSQDLMYSDQYIQPRSSHVSSLIGRLLFWAIMGPAVVLAIFFCVWLVFVKRW